MSDSDHSDDDDEHDGYTVDAAVLAATAVRLDARVASQLACSRAIAQRLIRAGAVAVDGAPCAKCTVKLPPTAAIVVDAALAGDMIEHAAQAAASVAAPLPDAGVLFDVVRETEQYVVVNKPYDLTVHPALSGDAATGTLVNGLLHRFGAASLSRGSDAARPGIVHRLDRYTSGLMVVARTDAAHESLSAQFARRSVDKRYRAIVVGKPNADDAAIAGITRTTDWRRIERAIGHAPDDTTRMVAHAPANAAAGKRADAKAPKGKHAITEYRIARCWRVRNTTSFYSLLDIRLLTGRTHQIRVHLSAIASPIVGDPIYSRQSNKQRVLTEESRTHLMLASTHLAFDDPTTGARASFDAPLPPHMQRLVQTLDDTLELVVGDEPAAAVSAASAAAAPAPAGLRIVKPKGAAVAAPVAKPKQQRKGKRDDDTKLVDEDDISL
jgi:23S rRNA pseudouridine1911/1915/1917 synthase